MPLINPVHGLVVPFMCIFTIPLAIFAGITTTLAFSVLMFRVAVVYLDIALALIRQYFGGRSQGKAGRSGSLSAAGQQTLRQEQQHHQFHKPSRDGMRTPISPPGSVGSGSGSSTPCSATSPYPLSTGYGTSGSGHWTPRRRKSSYGFGAALRQTRHSSSHASLASLGTITPINEDDVAQIPIESGLTPSIGMDRDFEGIGGWNLDDRDDAGDWANINSRLELPVERASFRHHQRSQSLGPTSPNDGTWFMPRGSVVRMDRSPEGKEYERRSSRSPGKPLASPLVGRRLNQTIALPSAMTALNPDNGYFPDLVSPRSFKKSTP